MSFLEGFVGFTGRMSRQRFWLSLLALLAVIVAINWLLIALGMGDVTNYGGRTTLSTGQVSEFNGTRVTLPPWVSLAIAALVGVPFAAIAIKRRHDCNRPGHAVIVYLSLYYAFGALQLSGLLREAWFMAFALAILVGGFALMVMLGFVRGTKGSNAYGPDPLLVAAAAEP